MALMFDNNSKEHVRVYKSEHLYANAISYTLYGQKRVPFTGLRNFQGYVDIRD